MIIFIGGEAFIFKVTSEDKFSRYFIINLTVGIKEERKS